MIEWLASTICLRYRTLDKAIFRTFELQSFLDNNWRLFMPWLSLTCLLHKLIVHTLSSSSNTFLAFNFRYLFSVRQLHCRYSPQLRITLGSTPVMTGEIIRILLPLINFSCHVIKLESRSWDGTSKAQIRAEHHTNLSCTTATLSVVIICADGCLVTS